MKILTCHLQMFVGTSVKVFFSFNLTETVLKYNKSFKVV